jgi:hypothetical protein
MDFTEPRALDMNLDPCFMERVYFPYLASFAILGPWDLVYFASLGPRDLLYFASLVPWR